MASPGATPDPDSIRLSIERTALYPRLARRQGVEGRVIVRFRVDSSGQPHDLTILTSAGPLLDDAARDAVFRAAPFAPTPGWVRVPVDFSLRAPR